MAENSKIEWTVHTWNPWMGCTQVSPACDDCYAMVMMDHRYGKVRWGAGEDRIRTSASNWQMPYRWDRAAAKAGRVDTVFCLSLGDIWDNEVDPLWRHQAFDVMRETPNLLYLLLSKRIGNAFVEVERHRMTRQQVVEDILHGQYKDVVTVIECNPVEHICDDITADVMAEVAMLRDDDTPQLRHATQQQKWDWQRGHREIA